jgi:hypothetical protein
MTRLGVDELRMAMPGDIDDAKVFRRGDSDGGHGQQQYEASLPILHVFLTSWRLPASA